MKLTPRFKRRLSRIIPFGVIWLVLSQIFLFIEYAAIGPAENTPSAAITLNLEIFLFASLAIGAVGLLVGTIEVVFLKDLFRNKSLTRKILYKTLVYTLFLYVVILITFPIAASMELGTSFFDPEVWQKFVDYLWSITHVSTSLQLAVQLIVSLLYHEISDHMGHGILINFFTGKYHTAKEEQRVFMFTDMKDSTTIAERLGHLQYFALLKQYYRDLADAIVRHSGEVYQYIGDEIVISWQAQKRDAAIHAIKCFYDMKKDLQSKSDWYQQQFGIAPDFKAGIHIGQVTTGEVGALKKEIIFTGDVLNTTARIQTLCQSFQTDLLVTRDLLDHLTPGHSFSIKALGSTGLKGKHETVELFTIEHSDVP